MKKIPWFFRSRAATCTYVLATIPVAWFLAYWLRFNFGPIPEGFFNQALILLPVIWALQGGMFWYFGLYRGTSHLASMPDLGRIIKAVMAGMVAAATVSFILTRLQGVPRSVFILDGILLILLVGGPRFVYRRQDFWAIPNLKYMAVSQTRRKVHSLIRGVALTLASTVFALALALLGLELAIRLGGIRWDSPPYNFHGAKTSGSFRVLVLGDSFTRPYPQRHGFGNLLENQLAKIDIKSLNLAWSGYGPLDSLRVLAREGRKFSPDLVLLSYYVGNDLSDTIWRMQGRSIEQAIAEARMPPRDWDGLILRLPSLLYVTDRWQRLTARLSPTASVEEVDPDIKPLNHFWYGVRRNAPDFHRVNLLLAGDHAAGGWKANREVLTQLHAETSVLGAQLVVFAFPSTLQVDTSHHQFFSKLGINVDPAFLETSKPQQLLAEFCAEKGIVFFDLLPAFRRHAGEALYWDRDDHWNVEGGGAGFWRGMEISRRIGASPRCGTGIGVRSQIPLILVKSGTDHGSKSPYRLRSVETAICT